MNKILVKQMLMSSSYWVLNKDVVKALGIETALLLSVFAEAETNLADDEGWFYQTAPAIEELTGLTNHKQTKAINQLIELGILSQINKGMPMKRYFKLNYEKVLEVLNPSFQKNLNQGFKKFKSKDSKNLKPCIQKISNNKEININNINKKTTTKLDNINYIEQPSNEVNEISSSLLEIKEFLSEKIKDVQTCKNIMKLVDKGLTLPRIKEVVEYSTKNNKGLGFIYQALENNWNLKEEKQEPRPRGHRQNFDAMDKFEESKKENQDFKNKLKSLDELYNSLSQSQQKEIDDIALKKATELYGKFVAPTMARTKVKYEVLEELLSMEQEEIA